MRWFSALGVLCATWVLLVTLAIANIPPVVPPPPPCDLVCLKIQRADLKRALEIVEAKIEKIKTPIKTDNFWLSFDVGQDLMNGLYTSVGISVPLGPIVVSPGYWWGTDNYTFKRDTIYHGFYVTLGYSWTLIK